MARLLCRGQLTLAASAYPPRDRITMISKITKGPSVVGEEIFRTYNAETRFLFFEFDIRVYVTRTKQAGLRIHGRKLTYVNDLLT